jgi:dTDP-glucose 4,6-dehydratase
MRLFVTGGCGFIGSNFVRHVLQHYHTASVTNVDVVTRAGNPDNTGDLADRFGNRYEFCIADIANSQRIHSLMAQHQFYAVINFASEAHVDRSINSPQNFVHTNVVGTSVLLECARAHGVRRFVQVSTDEVYGSCGPEGAFRETSPLSPTSPHAASKAAADMLALSYHRTYGMEVVVTRCSNNYGPYQFPGKLIPRMIIRALAEKSLPVIGDGLQIRDWIHVEDLCTAVVAALLEGRPGEVYNIGASQERKNIEIVEAILNCLGKPHSLIHYEADRLGHDRRHAIDSTKARAELKWKPLHDFDSGLPETISWYVNNRAWWERALKRNE